MGSFGYRSRVRCGFTLIELLVVIAIVALLVAILLPALASSRLLARQTVELSAGRQLIAAWHSYAADNRDHLLPTFFHPHMFGFGVFDPVLDNAGQELASGTASWWAWRLAPYVDHELRSFIVQRRQFKEYMTFDDDPQRVYTPRPIPGGGGSSVPSYQWAVANKPTLGMNYFFRLDGKVHSGDSVRLIKHPFHVERLELITKPSALLVFASARGPGLGPREADVSVGWMEVKAPRLRGFDLPYWDALVRWDASRLPGDFGQLDMRFNGQGVSAQADGHVETVSLPDLRDMRRWVNQADRADWNPREN